MSFKKFVSNVQRVDETLLLGALVLSLVLLLAFQFRQASSNRKKLKGIPTVGSSGFIASWKDAFRFPFHSKEIIEKGYRKYHGSVFKVPLLDKWMIVVSGTEKIDDIRKSSPGQLSSLDATSELLQMDYMIGRDVFADPYHINVVRSALTRNIAVCFEDVADEIQEVFHDNIPMTEGRSQDYIKLNINFTVNVFACAHIINLFPSFLKPWVFNWKKVFPTKMTSVRVAGFILTPRRRALAKAEKLLDQTIRERLHKEDIHGNDWPGKPNDLLSWLLDATNGNKERRDVQDLITRILLLNLGAIHTTSMVFKTAVYALAAHPEYVEILRTEVELAITEEGWTKAAVGKMDRLDSFLKEAQRLYGDLGVCESPRTAQPDRDILIIKHS
ncbi:cytochrome P450 [Armillaria nabsnona]|nr:cytochrome P450 [Armillaria nabsnona]